MTQGQYKHEVMQKAILDHGKAESESAKLELSHRIAAMITNFWTEERALDYINYITAPNGTICPECKNTNY